MLLQKSKKLFAALTVVLAVAAFTGCNDSSKTETEIKTTDSMSMPKMDTMMMAPDSMMKMDTATTRPIVPVP